MDWTTGGHMGLMGFWWIVIFAVLVAVVWFAATAGRDRRTGNQSAEQELKRRYAAGDIDRGTYQRMLEDLRR